MTTLPGLPSASPGFAPLVAALADPAWGWAVGVLGAIAEFVRDPGEAMVAIGPGLVVTARGGVRLADPPGLVLVAHEAVSRRGDHWQQGLSACLPPASAALDATPAPRVVEERGPDAEALRPEDRGAVLFDLGLGLAHLRACVRTAAPELLDALRAGCGRPLLEPGNPAAAAIARGSPHRVFLTRAARIEVHQPIPPPDGRSPEGPHTHLLPLLLRSRRTHPATSRLPDGMVPVLEAFPPHPRADARGEPIAFDAGRHAAFQALLARHGPPEVLAEKRAVAAAILAGARPEAVPEAPTRAARAARRVALRQMARTHPGLPALAAWRARWDRTAAEDEAPPLPPGHG